MTDTQRPAQRQPADDVYTAVDRQFEIPAIAFAGQPMVPDDPQNTRRRFLKWMIGLGLGVFAVAFALPAFALRTLQTARSAVREGDVLVYAVGGSGVDAGAPINISQIPEGASVHAFPQNKSDNQENLIELIRLPGGGDEQGLVAYSAICTHLGCAVYATLNQDGHIACPCHNSQFDPANAAEVVGGPAPRALPSLPIAVQSNGEIVVNGGFSGPIGPQ